MSGATPANLAAIGTGYRGRSLPRFHVLKALPNLWHIVDTWHESVDVVMFPAHITGPAHVKITVTVEIIYRTAGGVLDEIAHRLARDLDRVGLDAPDLNGPRTPAVWWEPVPRDPEPAALPLDSANSLPIHIQYHGPIAHVAPSYVAGQRFR